jgi:hypothetical protein
MEDSLRLKRTEEIVSVEVGNVRFEMGALLLRGLVWTPKDSKKSTNLVSSHICTRVEAVAKSEDDL